jgi:hypothetical protein
MVTGTGEVVGGAAKFMGRKKEKSSLANSPCLVTT